jgi:hypothetical protein
MRRAVANDSVAGRSFDEFVAIDWSGARGNYQGIAVATCGAGNDGPTLVKSAGTRWTRHEIAEWLVAKLGGSTARPHRTGLCFPVFPYEEGCGYLAGSTAINDIFQLWSLIDEKSGADPDFGCRAFVDTRITPICSGEHPERLQGGRTASVARKLVCAELTRTRRIPCTSSLGPKQVGKASITGMRVLKDVRSRARNVAVWPFEPISKSALVEIYPTLFRMHANE